MRISSAAGAGVVRFTDGTEYANRVDEYRARYIARRDAGMCTRHGCKDPQVTGRVLCARHGEMSRANWRKRWGRDAALRS